MNMLKTITALAASALLLAGTTAPAAEKKLDYQAELQASPLGKVSFQPPSEDQLPDGEFGRMVRLGKAVFSDTKAHAGQYAGNGLSCSNCHLDNGRRAFSAPLWGAMGMYPKYRKKNDRVNTIQTRIQGCFKYSMNGTPPPADSEEMTALVTYGFWLAKGAPIGEKLVGKGFLKMDKPAEKPDYQRGRQIYAENCAVCHGANGEGTKVNGKYHFPPLWGADSYNWGAGMHRINTAAGFIKMNMPYGKGGSLSDQQAWDVALFINSHERPADPRMATVDNDLAKLDKTYHKHQCELGEEHEGHILGSGAER
jgi:thiosulfate dehydrogenase